MKSFEWDSKKNLQLQKERNISFEDIVFCMGNDGLLDEIDHPNSKKYPNQRIFIVEVDNYAYLVPFIEIDRKAFLKTIIPSRKATKLYLENL